MFARILYGVLGPSLVVVLSLAVLQPATAQSGCLNCGSPSQVSVSDDGPAEPVRPSNTGGYTVWYTVSNIPGGNADAWSISCAGSSNVTCTGVSTNSVSLAGGQSLQVSATYSVGAVGTGEISLIASGTTNGQANYTIYVAAFSVAVTPKGTTIAPRAQNTGGYSAVFTVQNTGSSQAQDTYSLACVQSAPVQCGSLTIGGQAVTSVSLAPSASATVTVSYSVGTAGSGTLKLTASGTASDQGSYNVPVASYSVLVTPRSGSAPTRPDNSGGYTQSWTVQNTGTGNDTYTLACVQSAPVTCGGLTVGGQAVTSVSLASGVTTTVVASYSVGAAGNGFLTLTVTGTQASAGPQAGDAGTYSVPVVHYGVAVTPQGGTTPERVARTGGYTANFTVQNTGSASDAYTLTCTGTPSSILSCTGLSGSSVTVGAGASTTVTASYNVGSVGTSTLSVTASDAYVSSTGSYSVPVVTYGVALAPHGGFVRAAPTTASSQSFTVHDTGSGPKTYNLTASCAGAVTGCSVQSTVNVGAGASAGVTVSYQSGAAGTSGTVKLLATQSDVPTVQDSGWVTVSAGTADSAAVDVSSVNSGPVVARDLCLTINARAGAAVECGDLRLVHPLPTTRTLSKARTPTLLYTSAHGHPYPLVAANVTSSATGWQADSVVATLLFGTVNKAHGAWAGTAWVPGATRRVVVGYDGLTDTTGVYSYTLQVVAWYAGVSRTTTVNGQLPIVNRKGSPFGAGWWLAGLERLNVGDMRWVGGDGSVRQYQPVTGQTNVWAAPSLDHPDTLKWDPVAQLYTRYVPHGVQVQFDAQGHHVATINRLQQRTRFAYDGVGRLDTLVLPPASAQMAYVFIYDATTGLLDSVISPAAGNQSRVTRFTYLGSELHTIRDPDLTTVTLGYVAGDTNRVASRTDRRGFVTTYSYDVAKNAVKDSLNLSSTSAIVTTLSPMQSQGLTLPVDTALASTLLDGPRTDVGDTTRFWLDRFGAPRRIRDALGDTTSFTRGDSRWPALVTRVAYANGRVVGAAYDTRGNISNSTDSSNVQNGRYATTRYVWNLTWDLDSIVARPEGDSLVMAYDPVTGNRLWQQDARGSASRVNFSYYASGVSNGQMATSQTPTQAAAGVKDSLVYDATLGNLSATKTPLGFWTHLVKDALGRDTLVLTPTAAGLDSVERQRTAYNLADRDTLTQSIGPGLPYTNDSGRTIYTSAETLTVRTYRNPEGAVDSLKRSVSPDPNNLGVMETRWRYDPAGRPTKEVAPDTAADSTVYDAAGNPDSIFNRRGFIITQTYDALNRLTRRIVPPVTQGPVNFVIGSGQWHFPLYRLDGTGGLETLNDSTHGYTVPGDTATFGYDGVGNMLRADNGTALIRRRYNPNGTLAADTIKLHPYIGVDTTQHVYGLQFRYDLDGRRTWLHHPDAIAPRTGGAVRDSETYAYDPGTGALASIVDVVGNQVGFRYDLDGRIRAITLGGAPDSLVYDGDDRLIRRVLLGVHDDTLSYDARGKTVQAATMGEHVTMAYDGLGGLAWSLTSREYQTATMPEEQYTLDALGNSRHVRRTPNYSNLIAQPFSASGSYLQAGTGRLDSTRTAPDTETNPPTEEVNYSYTRAGDIFDQARVAQSQTTSGNPGILYEEALHYYDAAGHLRLLDRRTCVVPQTGTNCDPNGPPDYTDRAAFEEIRYDALGRRVFMRTRSEWECSMYCFRAAVRTVWDGDDVLYEVSAPGFTGAGATMEKDTGIVVKQDSNVYFPSGRIVYTHGQKIDEPLVFVRMEYSDSFYAPVTIWPNANWRGAFDNSANSLPCVTEWVHDSTITDSSQTSVCMQINWPAPYMWMTKYERPRSKVGPASWMGSLIESGRDPSGEMYMRNRYYDPRSGRFTQEDPLGLAGGLNLYGFAGGDPVNFSDPFGLCPLGNCTQSQRHYAVDAAGASFIQQHESTVLQTYTDEAGHLTIGTGHALAPGESYPNGITDAQAATLFQKDMASVVQPSLDRINDPTLDQDQVNALGDFTFNEGGRNFGASVLPSINKGDHAGAASHMANFTKITKNGRKVTDPILVRRRKDDLALFNKAQ